MYTVSECYRDKTRHSVCASTALKFSNTRHRTKDLYMAMVFKVGSADPWCYAKASQGLLEILIKTWVFCVSVGNYIYRLSIKILNCEYKVIFKNNWIIFWKGILCKETSESSQNESLSLLYYQSRERGGVSGNVSVWKRTPHVKKFENHLRME
jgi:hypothetical protein